MAPLTRAKPPLEIHSVGDSLANFVPILDAELSAVEPCRDSARIASDGTKTELSNFDLTLEQSKATGTLSLNKNSEEERPSIAVQLTLETLDVTEYNEDQRLEDIKENEA